jgi:hypothetical protein
LNYHLCLWMNQRLKSVTLRHLLVKEQKMIGLKFYPDKVIQALIKELPEIKWSNTFQMAFIPNNKINLDLIFNKFKGLPGWTQSIFSAPGQLMKAPIFQLKNTGTELWRQAIENVPKNTCKS